MAGDPRVLGQIYIDNKLCSIACMHLVSRGVYTTSTEGKRTHQVLHAITQYTPAWDGSSAFTGISRVRGPSHLVSIDPKRFSNSSIGGEEVGEVGVRA